MSKIPLVIAETTENKDDFKLTFNSTALIEVLGATTPKEQKDKNVKIVNALANLVELLRNYREI